MVKGFSSPADDIFVPTELSSMKDKLEPGLYETSKNISYGYFFKKLHIENKKLFAFEDNTSDVIIKDIEKFWSIKDKYAKYKMPFKRGILMYGPPGCGKSSIISLLTQSVLRSGGIIVKFNINLDTFKNCMRLLRNLEPEMPIIVLMEDLNYVLDNCDESEVLNMLDGLEKFSHSTVYLASTNYFKELEDNIKNRPSRFDLVVEVKPPLANIRRSYLERLLLDGDEIPNLEQWVKDSEGFSFAHLEELFKSVFLFENSYDQTINRIKLMNSSDSNSD